MSHKPDRVLRQIFQHPMVLSIKWSDVVHMFEAFGAEVEVVHGTRERVKLNGQQKMFRIPHGRAIDDRNELTEIRHFLERAGITPDDHP